MKKLIVAFHNFAKSPEYVNASARDYIFTSRVCFATLNRYNELHKLKPFSRRQSKSIRRYDLEGSSTVRVCRNS